MTSIISQIVTGVETVWVNIVKDVETDAQKIIAALGPTVQTQVNAVVSDIKQGASNAISMADSALNNAAPAATSAVEAAADAALVKYTGGLALPLVGATNDAIEGIENLLVSTANSWALKAKAALAENNAKAGGGA